MVQFVCVACHQQHRNKPLVTCAETDTIARCPTCHRRYNVRTATVASWRAIYATGVRYRYVLRTQEAGDGVRTYRFVGPSGISLRPGGLVTIVRRHGKTIGLAGQANKKWWPLDLPDTSWSKKIALIPQICIVLLAGIYLGFRGHAALTAVQHSWYVWLGAILLAALLVAPWLARDSFPLDTDDGGWADTQHTEPVEKDA